MHPLIKIPDSAELPWEDRGGGQDRLAVGVPFYEEAFGREPKLVYKWPGSKS